jgi:hypothetical protein
MEGMEAESDKTSLPARTSEKSMDDIAVQTLIADLDRDLKKRRRQRFWHWIWTLLGVSPAALLPLVGLVEQGVVAPIVVLVVGVTGMEWWRAVRAGKDVYALELRLWELHTGEGELLEEGEEPGS